MRHPGVIARSEIFSIASARHCVGDGWHIAVGGRRHLKPVGWPVTLTGVSVTGPATGLFGQSFPNLSLGRPVDVPWCAWGFLEDFCPFGVSMSNHPITVRLHEHL